MAVAYLVVAVLGGTGHRQLCLFALGRGGCHILHSGGLLTVAVAHGSSIIVQGVLVLATVEIHFRHHLPYLVLLENILLQQQCRSHLQQLVVLAEIVVDTCHIRGYYLGKLVVRLQLLEIAKCQVILALHVLQMGIIIERGIGVLRATVDVLGKEFLCLGIVLVDEIAVPHLEVILATMAVFHLASGHFLVILQRLGIVACGIVVVAQIEVGHIRVLVLGIATQKLRETEIGVAVAQPLGAHCAIEAGLPGHLVVHP